MKGKSTRKLTLAGVLVAVAVIGSLFSIPVFGAKCSPVQHMVNVVAGVLLGPWYAVAMAFAAALIRNLLAVTSQKNLALSRRIFHTSPKTIRGRLLSYLSAQALRENSRSFAIPFDRQQLADYLGVDRSALSAELGRMRAEGLIRFRKIEFELLREP